MSLGYRNAGIEGVSIQKCGQGRETTPPIWSRDHLMLVAKHFEEEKPKRYLATLPEEG